MRDTPANAEGSLSLLDQSAILYGSSNSTTHTNRNYPLVLAGGKGMGFRHGTYHRFAESVPLSNLQLTMLQRAIEAKPHLATQTGNQRMDRGGRRMAVLFLQNGCCAACHFPHREVQQEDGNLKIFRPITF